MQDRLKLLHLPETDLLISCKFAPDGFQDVPAHRRQSNFQVFKQELVRHFPQATILHNLRNGRHKLGAQFLPLSPLCELLHTVLLQFGDWTARCEPRLHCPWCFHILQWFIHLTWVAHCCRRFLYCNFNVLYSTIHMCVCIYIYYVFTLFAMHIIYVHYIYVYFNSYLTYYVLYVSYIYTYIVYSIVYILHYVLNILSYIFYNHIVYIVYCILYRVYCILLFFTYYILYNIHCTSYIIDCILFTTCSALYTMYCMYYIWYGMYYIL